MARECCVAGYVVCLHLTLGYAPICSEPGPGEMREGLEHNCCCHRGVCAAWAEVRRLHVLARKFAPARACREQKGLSNAGYGGNMSCVIWQTTRRSLFSWAAVRSAHYLRTLMSFHANVNKCGGPIFPGPPCDLHTICEHL